MAIKKVTFSFDIPIENLLALVAAGNAGMRVDVYGSDKTKALPKALTQNAHAGLLEGPRPSNAQRGTGIDENGQPIKSMTVVLKHLAQRPAYISDLNSIKTALHNAGLTSPATHHSQMYTCVKNGWAVRLGAAQYKLTAEGLRECARRGVAIAEAPKSDKATKGKAKPNGNGKDQAVGVERQHG
ncbi:MULTISPECIES: hypothetical protein [unclassified Bradyrhizobium]|uniref:hypothetical protein n=1 Tax=unclassified Bradyrhizobium TaxID=2631580 RepID=UPI002FF2E5D8